MLNMVNEIAVDALCYEVRFIHLVEGIVTGYVATFRLGYA